MDIPGFGSLSVREVDITWCPHCRKSVRGSVLFWDNHSRMLFDSEDCAIAWAMAQVEELDSNEKDSCKPNDSMWTRIKAWWCRVSSSAD